MEIGYVVNEVLSIHFNNKDSINTDDWNFLVEQSVHTARTISEAYNMNLGEFRNYICEHSFIRISEIVKTVLDKT
ncbi:hypothetical protein ACG9XS_08665 [Acinetobacter gyllenbergii]|nr:hypothetical protein F987_02154 [Acinetobacter gyllenbergii NIPH 230]